MVQQGQERGPSEGQPSHTAVHHLSCASRGPLIARSPSPPPRAPTAPSLSLPLPSRRPLLSLYTLLSASRTSRAWPFSPRKRSLTAPPLHDAGTSG